MIPDNTPSVTPALALALCSPPAVLAIEYEQEPGGKCPVQAEGKINGLPFYFRSRGGHWSLSIAHAPDGDPLDYANSRVHCAPYDGVNRDEPQDFHGHKVQFGAGWAEPDECRVFIARAAALLLANVQAEPRGPNLP
jgi:hypothetical protein